MDSSSRHLMGKRSARGRHVFIAGLLLVLSITTDARPPELVQREGEAHGIAALLHGPIEHLQELIVSGALAGELRLTPAATYPGGTYNTGGYYDNGDIVGQRLTVVGGGRTYWNMRLKGWGQTGNMLRGWQARVDPASLKGENADCGGGAGSCLGAGDLFVPAVPCGTSATCTAAFGEAKNDETYTLTRTEHCDGGFCQSAFPNDLRPDWLFASLIDPQDLIFACVTPPPGPICFGVFSGEMADEGLDYYGGTLVLDVPADARGLYKIEWDPSDSFYLNFSVAFPFAALVPGELEVLVPCACETDVDGNGIINVVDTAIVVDCVRDGLCEACVNDCDIDCSGAADWSDFGAVSCAVLGLADCCNRPEGACTGANASTFPNCMVTQQEACEIHGGTYLGHGTSCPQECGGLAGTPCEAGQFCKYPIGTCNVADRQGLCLQIPDNCPLDIYNPVCGCDGVTYTYDCFADMAEQSVDFEGECDPSTCVATRQFSANYCPGRAEQVTIALDAPTGTEALAVEDAPPADWVVGPITNDGFYDSVNHKVKWGPLFAPFPAQVSYSVTPSANAATSCFAGTVSVDGANQSVCGSSCQEESCCEDMEAETQREACTDCTVASCSECTEGSCADGVISLCEMISYACAWKRGCNDDIGGMTRAAFIWRNGECYCWDDTEQTWVPSDCASNASACCATSAIATAGGKGTAAPDGEAVFRIKTEPHNIWKVTIDVLPNVGTSATAVEITVPNRWNVVEFGDGGLYDLRHRKIKWGPYFGDEALSLVVTMQAPEARSSRDGRSLGNRGYRGGKGAAVELDGTVSFDGRSRPIAIGN